MENSLELNVVHFLMVYDMIKGKGMNIDEEIVVTRRYWGQEKR